MYMKNTKLEAKSLQNFINLYPDNAKIWANQYPYLSKCGKLNKISN